MKEIFVNDIKYDNTIDNIVEELHEIAGRLPPAGAGDDLGEHNVAPPLPQPVSLVGRENWFVKHDPVEGESMVDATGYLNTSEHIRQMVAAGERLTAHREEHFPNDGWDDEDPPVEMPVYMDVFEAWDRLQSLSTRLEKKKVAAELAAKVAEEASATAPAAGGDDKEAGTPKEAEGSAKQ